MGIKSINEFLKSKVPEAFYTKELEDFNGYRMSIDSFNYIYSLFCACSKSVIYEMPDPMQPIPRENIINKVKTGIIYFILKLLRNRITPVFVWDGLPMEEKTICKSKRTDDKNKILAKIEAKKIEIEKIHPLYRTKELYDTLKSLLTQYNYTLPDEIEYLKKLISELGFPSIQAEHEGEKLCSALAREGLVCTVYSTDTDNYALGTPLLSTSFEGTEQVNVVDLKVILQKLNKTHVFFVDFCILCGCDFNTNIKNIGPARAYTLLEKHDNIEKIESEGGKDISVLNHIRTREIFTYTPSNISEEQLNFNLSVFQKNSERIFSEYELEKFNFQLSENVKCISDIPKNKKKIKINIIK